MEGWFMKLKKQNNNKNKNKNNKQTKTKGWMVASVENTCGDWFPVIVKCKALRDPQGFHLFSVRKAIFSVWRKELWGEGELRRGFGETGFGW